MDLTLNLDDLDVSVEQAELEKVRGDINVLHGYYDQIVKTGGISRSQAQSLVHDCGVSFESYPLTAFTEIPSRTNLSLAMESILGTAGAMVWNLIKKAAGILRRIMRWLIDNGRKLLGLKRDVAKAERALQVMRPTVDKYRAATEAVTEETPEIRHSQQALSVARDKYITHYTQFVHDLLTDQVFSNMIRNTAIELWAWMPIYTKACDLFGELVNTGMQANGDAGTHTQLANMLTEQAQPTPIPRLLQLIGNGGVDLRHAESMSEGLTVLRAAQQEKTRTASGDVIEPVEAFFVLKNEENLIHEPMIPEMEQWLDGLEALEKHIAKLEHIVPAHGAIPENLQKLYLKAYDRIDTEITSMRVFYVSAMACESARIQLFHDVAAYDKADLQLTAAKIKAGGEDAVKHEFQNDLNHISAVVRAA